jgi:hypothetical protein
MKYTCHSGGCPGSDMEWEIQGEKYGVVTVAYSFKGHKQEGKNPKILTGAELNEGWEHVLIANKNLKLYPQGQSTYVKSLLSRNWFQVKNATAIFAIGKFRNNKVVDGGTGWAVQMAIDNKKPVFFFNQPTNAWYSGTNYDGNGVGYFIEIDGIPTLTQDFAGIGTREIEQNGKNAIRMVYEKNCKSA